MKKIQLINLRIVIFLVIITVKMILILIINSQKKMIVLKLKENMLQGKKIVMNKFFQRISIYNKKNLIYKMKTKNNSHIKKIVKAFKIKINKNQIMFKITIIILIISIIITINSSNQQLVVKITLFNLLLLIIILNFNNNNLIIRNKKIHKN